MAGVCRERGVTVIADGGIRYSGDIVKALAGGELKGITELLQETRAEALSRLAAEAQQKGANAVVAFRFETNDYGDTGGVVVCAYGTAVTIA